MTLPSGTVTFLLLTFFSQAMTGTLTNRCWEKDQSQQFLWEFFGHLLLHWSRLWFQQTLWWFLKIKWYLNPGVMDGLIATVECPYTWGFIIISIWGQFAPLIILLDVITFAIHRGKCSSKWNVIMTWSFFTCGGLDPNPWLAYQFTLLILLHQH